MKHHEMKKDLNNKIRTKKKRSQIKNQIRNEILNLKKDPEPTGS